DRYAVTALRISDGGDVVGTPRRLTCKYLFLAAGSIGTTSLLVRARATRALPALNDHVGRHWAANGDIPVTRGALPLTNAGTGGPAGHFIMEDLDNPLGPTSLVELVLPPRSEEHTSELQSRSDLVCRLLLEKKKKKPAIT